MDTTKIYAILKKTTHPRIATDNKGGQWIGDGNAYYNVDGLPELNKDNLLPVIGIDIDTKSKYTVIEENLPSEEIILRDGAEGDGCVELTDLNICGRTVMRGVGLNAPKCAFINDAYLKPFSKDDEISFVTREADNSVGYIIIVKRGLFTVAAIAPMYFSQGAYETYAEQLKIDLAAVIEALQCQRQKTECGQQITFTEIQCRN